jgi:hypothetical protein
MFIVVVSCYAVGCVNGFCGCYLPDARLFRPPSYITIIRPSKTPHLAYHTRADTVPRLL